MNPTLTYLDRSIKNQYRDARLTDGFLPLMSPLGSWNSGEAAAARGRTVPVGQCRSLACETLLALQQWVIVGPSG